MFPGQFPPPDMTDEEKRTMKLNKAFEKGAEGCIFKAILSAVVGGGFGAFMGMLMSNHSNTDAALPKDASTRLKVVTHFKELGKSSWGMAKNFAMVGLVFAGTECVIERARAKSDIYNSLGAGCISGAALSYRNGAKGMAFGCAGFMAFSYVIDKVMMDKDPREEDDYVSETDFDELERVAIEEAEEQARRREMDDFDGLSSYGGPVAPSKSDEDDDAFEYYYVDEEGKEVIEKRNGDLVVALPVATEADGAIPLASSLSGVSSVESLSSFNPPTFSNSTLAPSDLPSPDALYGDRGKKGGGASMTVTKGAL
eukprot:TRINITY_DN4477_c0_g4_i1.p1 TRINITY_DN4477_c0_g4~~TRINITY_DN4477_c0_g4_i1.p1  ORF type:complete len:312 (-),score=90.84 TRINITY_DN4477_c0_g4_i1:1223-2158(-)